MIASQLNHGLEGRATGLLGVFVPYQRYSTEAVAPW